MADDDPDKQEKPKRKGRPHPKPAPKIEVVYHVPNPLKPGETQTFSSWAEIPDDHPAKVQATDRVAELGTIYALEWLEERKLDLDLFASEDYGEVIQLVLLFKLLGPAGLTEPNRDRFLQLLEGAARRAVERSKC